MFFIILFLECPLVLLSCCIQVTPISNLISKCEALWMSAISGTQCDAKTIKRDGCCKHFTTKVTSCCCTIRRIISSEDIGCIMVGTLKVSNFIYEDMFMNHVNEFN